MLIAKMIWTALKNIYKSHVEIYLQKFHILSCQMLICGQPSHNMNDDLMHALLQLRAKTLQQCIQTALLSLSLSYWAEGN